MSSLSTLEEVHPDAHAPTLLFLHGAGVPALSWHAQLEAFRDSHHCVAVDLPGHGDSHRLDWRSLEDCAAQVETLLGSRATAGFDGPVHLVGLSMGADVGLRLLARNPHRFAGAVLSGIVAEPVTGWVRRLQLSTAWMVSLPWFHRLSIRMLKLPRQRTDEALARIPPLRADDYRRILDAIMGGVSLEGLETVTAPTLILAGTREAAVAKRSTSVVARKMPLGVAGMVPKAMHTWPLGEPERFSEVLRAWLERPGTLPEGVIAPV
ncbi:MAG TPA: alpha/beta hydrolase [Myxococcaceae bacterium]|nr:alpha/beta hydrolase [Myxococcaceae bacterium]